MTPLKFLRVKSILTTELPRNIPHPSGNNRNEHCIITSKIAYQRLLKPITKPPTAQNSLINLLGLTDINWKKVFFPRQATIESSLRSFWHKILNEKLFKFKIVIVLYILCVRQKMNHTTFILRVYSYKQLLEQFKLRVSDISLFDKIDIDPQTIIFGAWNLNTSDFILINHMILLFKRSIYLRRQDRHGPNITSLKSFVKNIETVERRIAFSLQKWEKLVSFL